MSILTLDIDVLCFVVACCMYKLIVRKIFKILELLCCLSMLLDVSSDSFAECIIVSACSIDC